MVDNFGGNWFDLGAQMAQAWQQVLEKWWQALLDDPIRLRELSARLGWTPGAASAADFERIVKALELMQVRIAELEKKVEQLGGRLAGRQPD
jgi:hypothetical protein